MRKLFQKNKGVALLWSLVLTVLFMIITGTMVGYIVKESRMAINITDSTKAYANAKTGIEWGADLVKKNPPVTSGKINEDIYFETGNAKNLTSVEITPSGTVNASGFRFPYKITSTGKYNNLERKINYIITEESSYYAVTDPDQPLGFGNNSFNFNFNFMLEGAIPTGAIFGVGKSDGSEYAALKVADSSGSLKLITRLAGESSATSTDVLGNDNTPLSISTVLTDYSVQLSYLKGHNINIKILDSAGNCIGHVTRATGPNLNFTNNDNIYHSSPIAVIPPGTDPMPSGFFRVGITTSSLNVYRLQSKIVAPSYTINFKTDLLAGTTKGKIVNTDNVEQTSIEAKLNERVTIKAVEGSASVKFIGWVFRNGNNTACDANADIKVCSFAYLGETTPGTHLEVSAQFESYVDIYRGWNNAADWVWGTDSSEGGTGYGALPHPSTGFHVYLLNFPGATSLYRLQNLSTGDRLLSTTLVAGFNTEGTWYISNSSATGIPVYRRYRNTASIGTKHFFSTSSTEGDTIFTVPEPAPAGTVDFWAN